MSVEKQKMCIHEALVTIDKLDWVSIAPILTEAEIVQCQNCSFVFTKGYPITNKGIRELNTSLDVSFETPPHRSKSKAETLDRLFTNMGLTSSATTVLDYGGGTGRTANELRLLGWESFSYDPFAQADQELEESICLGDADVKELTKRYEGGKGLVVTLFHVLEHIPDPAQFLLDLKDTFGTKALFVIEVPVLELEFAQSWDPSSFFAPFHASHFSKQTLARTLASAGLSELFHESFIDYNGHLVFAEAIGARSIFNHHSELKAIGLIESEAVSNYMTLRQEMEDWLVAEIEEIYSASDIVIFWGLGVGLDSIFRMWQPADWQKTIFVDRNRKRAEGLPSRYPQAYQTATPEDFVGPDFFKRIEGRKVGVIPSSYAKSRQIIAEAINLFGEANSLKFLTYPLVRSY